MRGYDAETYGDVSAGGYDARYADRRDEVEVAAGKLCELAGRGPVLEVGVGTGMVAEAVAGRGIPVVGIDSSAAMLAVAEKKAVRNLALCRVDATADPLPGTYRLVYCVFNTFFMLGDDSAQLRFLRNVQDALDDAGRLVIETFAPRQSRLDTWTSRVLVAEMSAASVTLVASMHDKGRQLLENQEILIRDGRIELTPTQFHYHSPEQLDDLADAAGLALESRWSDWSGTGLTPESTRMIAVYKRRTAGGSASAP